MAGNEFWVDEARQFVRVDAALPDEIKMPPGEGPQRWNGPPWPRTQSDLGNEMGFEFGIGAVQAIGPQGTACRRQRLALIRVI